MDVSCWPGEDFCGIPRHYSIRRIKDSATELRPYARGAKSAAPSSRQGRGCAPYRPMSLHTNGGSEVAIQSGTITDMQMILATPNETYDQTVASRLLKPFNTSTDVDPIVTKLTQDRVIHRNTSAAQSRRYYSFTAT